MQKFSRFEEKVWLSTPTIHKEEMEYIKEAFDTNWVTPLGKNVDCFEKEIAAYIGVTDGAACVSGTSAMFLAYKLAGVKRGDIVFCSDMTFAATVNPITYLGGIPVFIDSERDTWNMDPEALAKAFDKYPQCKVVSIVHLYGVPARIDEIKAICDAHGAILIEDAAESLSSTFRGAQTGSFGKFGIVSFNGNKIITSSGGGMLVSNDAEAIQKARFLSTQARDKAPWYQHTQIGYNFRMSNIVAGIGRGQLQHLEEHRERKVAIYERYKAGLAGIPVTMNPYMDCTKPNFWLSCLLIDADSKITPMDIYHKLGELNVETRPIWKPMHMQPVYAECDFIKAGDQPVNEDIFARGLCLPSDIKMTAEVQDKVIEIIRSCFE